MELPIPGSVRIWPCAGSIRAAANPELATVDLQQRYDPKGPQLPATDQEVAAAVFGKDRDA